MVKAFLEADEVKRLEEAANNLRDRLLIRLLSSRLIDHNSYPA